MFWCICCEAEAPGVLCDMGDAVVREGVRLRCGGFGLVDCLRARGGAGSQYADWVCVLTEGWLKKELTASITTEPIVAQRPLLAKVLF